MNNQQEELMRTYVGNRIFERFHLSFQEYCELPLEVASIIKTG